MSFLKKLVKSEELLNRGQQILEGGLEKVMKKQPSGEDGGSRTQEPANEQWNSSVSKGQKRALFVGINYFGQKGELRGCINDVKNIREFVEQRCGFSHDCTRVLTDDQKDPAGQPTRDNIMSAMRWLVEGAKAGDSLFLHYSGHGAYQDDKDGDEGDGKDETICPVDYAQKGMISDDDMHAIMLKNLPAGVRFTAIFDCCHSGSVLDLPFTYTVDGNLDIIEIDNRVEGAKKLLRAGFAYMQGKNQEAMRGVMDGIKTLAIGDKKANGTGAVHKDKVEEKMTAADVIQFSGCRDDQTSADAVIENESTGAMSHAFIRALEQANFKITYQDLLKNTRQFLHQKYSQVPQMSAGRKLDMSVQFQL